MIEQFLKKEILYSPAHARVEDTYTPLEADQNQARCLPQVQEKTIILNVGGQDYDIRDLIWRLYQVEQDVCQLRNRVVILEAESTKRVDSEQISCEVEYCVDELTRHKELFESLHRVFNNY